MTTQIFSLESKTAVVTGGTSGIGRALSLGLADAGADVIATARRQQEVDQTADAVEARGRKTLRLVSDVCNRESLETLLAAVVERFGKVDILINCAGKIKRTPTSRSLKKSGPIFSTPISPEPCAPARSSASTCLSAATAASSISPR